VRDRSFLSIALYFLALGYEAGFRPVFSDIYADTCLPIGRSRGMDAPEDRFTGVRVAGIAGVLGVGLDGQRPSAVETNQSKKSPGHLGHAQPDPSRGNSVRCEGGNNISVATLLLCFEQITRERVRRGELPDDAPERLVAARTPVAVQSNWLTPATTQFMEHNYISIGSVLVLGKRIFPPPDGHVQFEIVIPEKYTIISRSGPLSGALDGTNLNGPHDLSAGVHQLILNSPVDVVAVVWSRAIEKGYSMQY